MKTPLFSGVVLLCALLQSACIRYTAQPLYAPDLEARFRSRSLDDPALQEFIRKQASAQDSAAMLKTPDLNTLTYVAFYYNPELNVARAQVASALADVKLASQRINPSLAGGGGYNKTPDSLVTYSVAPTFTLETAGKRGYRILAAEKSLEAARSGFYETVWRVQSQVRAAFASYYFAVAHRAELSAEDMAQTETVDIYLKRVAVGEAARPELDAMRAEQANDEIAERAAEGDVAQKLTDLATAIGVPVTALNGRQLSMNAFEHPPSPDGIALVPAQQAGLLHRADIRRTLAEYEAADARYRLELANQYPNIPLSPEYSLQEGFPAYTLNSAIDSIPLFHHHQGQIAEAEAARNEVKARFVALQAQAIGQTESALRQYRAAYIAWLASRDDLTKVQEQREAAVTVSFREGESDRLDLTLARLLTISAEQATTDSLVKVQTALAALEDAVQSPLETGVHVDQVPLRDPALEHAQ